MEQDSSPRKIQFTVPLLEPHLDPEAAEQGTRPAKDEGPRDWWNPGSLPGPPLAARPFEDERSFWGGGSSVPSPTRLLSMPGPARVALFLPSPGGGGLLEDTTPPSLNNPASLTQSTPTRVSKLGGGAEGNSSRVGNGEGQLVQGSRGQGSGTRQC
ncbi:hypothetical protein P7K49_019721 [Saguinus oedipus]|uniref:Uncharacterized protein n=1 Tax=Saguinus oedipus TaxID=9490 RepID=A0ABQ9UZ50_SAGOE|nr:hypothetical protein P7K49_019721 [Saguinus oedipus]